MSVNITFIGKPVVVMYGEWYRDYAHSEFPVPESSLPARSLTGAVILQLLLWYTIFLSLVSTRVIEGESFMEKVELGWDEFWARVFRIWHRQSIQGIQHYDRLVVDFCFEALGLKKGAQILDIACGAGDQSIEFAKHGLNVMAFDISKALIDVAKERAKADHVKVDFFTGDMREMSFDQKFDAAVMLSHSFGFFRHETNEQVLRDSHDLLKDGGRLLLDLMNPYNLPRFNKTWVKLEGGFLLSEPHVLDAPAGVLTGRPAIFIDTQSDRIVLMNEDALANNNIRMYTALEIREMLKAAGFSKVELYGQNKLPRMQYCADSERMVVIATR
ncbi:MAG: hypothetical protein DRP09_02210 [Candidatus Thorarchaeota archaeon]|nr:MAG: hypothetical protein DRP09_02210 [Candidatus Thorarchaeota archaeon]